MPNSPESPEGEATPQPGPYEHPLRNTFRALDVFRELTDPLSKGMTRHPWREVVGRLQSAREQSEKILSSVHNLPFEVRMSTNPSSADFPAIFDGFKSNGVNREQLESFAECLAAYLDSAQAVSKVPTGDTHIDSNDHETIAESLDHALSSISEFQARYLKLQWHQLKVPQSAFVLIPSEDDRQQDATDDLGSASAMEATSGDLKVATQDSAFVQVGKLKYATRLASVL